MSKNSKASPFPIGVGRKVRRARNIIKRYGALQKPEAKLQRRLARAVALVAWADLSK